LPIDRENTIAACPWIPILIGLSAATLALLPADFAGSAAVFSVVAFLTLYAVCLIPNRWLYLFFAADLLTPPLGGSLGGAGIHLSIAIAGLGLFGGALHLPAWRLRRSRLLIGFAAFALTLLASLPFAWLYSGWEVASGSALRIGLFLIGVYVFGYVLCGPATGSDERTRFAAFLFVLAAIAAAFACLDYYLQFPAPAGFSQQYVWLDDGVFRRAQGLFYDASTLGNFCAFFLLYGLIALFEPGRAGRAWRVVLAAGALVLATALILSYSRASLLNLAIALAAYTMVRGAGLGRISIGILIGGAIAMLAIQVLRPSFAAGYQARIAGSIHFFGERPDSVLSGRLTSWNRLFEFIAAHPWQALFGIGYKTLPYTEHMGDPVTADNTYLSLLVETGIAGLGSFLLLLAGILKATWRVARYASASASFLGKWAFCFWCGQTVQMLSGDLLTYWRVLPIYFWALAAALREAEEAP